MTTSRYRMFPKFRAPQLEWWCDVSLFRRYDAMLYVMSYPEWKATAEFAAYIVTAIRNIQVSGICFGLQRVLEQPVMWQPMQKRCLWRDWFHRHWFKINPFKYAVI